MKISRRHALKTLGAMGAAAGAARFLPGCGDDGPPAGPTGITTWVFMMMENRSYDHYLGSRALVEGLPGDGLTAGMTNLDTAGTAQAIWPATADAMTQCVADPPHGWDASRVQFGGGMNDGFVRAYQSAQPMADPRWPMMYLTRDQLPVTHALADAHTSCDRWFCSVMGPTLPNRMYWHAGTSNGAKANDEVLDGAFNGVPSLYHRLAEAGVDWAYYFNDVPVLGVIEDLDLTGRLRRFFYEFIDDAAAGRLPPIVYIDPGFGTNDDHPPHHPLLGQQLIAATYQALATSPQWNNIHFVLTYDENGGFFDHVAPPTAPDDRAADGFDQLGFRVPTVVAGPYARAGHVSSVVRDHTSCLKHLQTQFGLGPMGMRTAAATDLSETIDQARLAMVDPLPPTTLPAVELDESMLPESCFGRALRTTDHDLLAWAEANRRKLGKLDLRRHSRDTVYGIAEFLDKHNLGRIRRGR